MVLAARALAKDAQAVALDVGGEKTQGALNRNLRAERPAAAAEGDQYRRGHGAGRRHGIGGARSCPSRRPRRASRSSASTTRSTASPRIPAKAKQNDRFAVVLKITEPQPQFGRLIVADYLPAGFEIDNPRLVSSGDTGTLAWIEDAQEPVNAEFRDDRFSAAFERKSGDPSVFTVAYVVRAVSPGRYVQPQAFVEDMYRPDRFGRTATGDDRGHGGEMRTGGTQGARRRAALLESARLIPGRKVRSGRARASDRACDDGLCLGAGHRVSCADCSGPVCGGAWWIASLGPAPLGEGLAFSTLVVDRDGKLLRPYTTPDGRWRLPASARARRSALPAAAARLRGQALWHASRRRPVRARPCAVAIGRSRPHRLRRVDHHHAGGAAARAAHRAQLHGEAAPDGACARDSSARSPRTKSWRCISASRPYGGNLEGVRAASLAYFGKEPRRLTLGEAALLVALPQSPEQRRPDRSKRCGAQRARPGARPPRRGGRRSAGRGRPRQARAGAGRTQAHADAGAACRRRSDRGCAGSQPASPHHRRDAAAQSRGPGARARPCARLRHLRRDPCRRSCAAGRCSPASPRPTTSTSVAPGRST